MTKLSGTAKENLKVKFRELMITTMDYCIESAETQNKSIEVFSIIANDIKRELKQDEIEKINDIFAHYTKSLVCPYNTLDKELTYGNIFNYMEEIING
jgi:hypothetical protein